MSEGGGRPPVPPASPWLYLTTNAYPEFIRVLHWLAVSGEYDGRVTNNTNTGELVTFRFLSTDHIWDPALEGVDYVVLSYKKRTVAS